MKMTIHQWSTSDLKKKNSSRNINKLEVKKEWTIFQSICRLGGARGVMVIVVGNEHGVSRSNPGRDWLRFT